MKKIYFVYFLHAALVVITAYILAQVDISAWYFTLLIAIPLILSFIPKYSRISYGVNIRFLFPISVGLFCVALYHAFPSLMVDQSAAALSRYGISSGNSGLEQGFFEVNNIFKDSVSVLYAICAAFLLWKGLNDFDELKHVLYEEVNEIHSIANYLSFFVDGNATSKADKMSNEKTARHIKRLMYEYLQNILLESRIVVSQTNRAILKKLSDDASKIRVGDANDQIALEEIMKAITRLSTLRSRRKVCIEKRMSPYILTLMFLMSVAMVSSFFGDATGKLSIDYAYVFLMSGFYTALFMTLIDLSSPFEGYWSIKLEAVRETLELLEEFKDEGEGTVTEAFVPSVAAE